MNDIVKTIVKASSHSIPEAPSVEEQIDELYEDTDIDETEKEVLKTAATTDMEELYPNGKKDPEVDEDGYYNPYSKAKHRSAEAEIQDRLLTIPRRPKNAKWGSLWLIESGFIEQIALLNITKSEQKSLLRQWADIHVLSEADGNEAIVESEQYQFMLKIVSYKSRSDNPEKGIRERTAHITNKTIADQTINMPKGEAQRSGFLNTILGRKVQQQ
jgi:hypothetical protein